MKLPAVQHGATMPRSAHDVLAMRYFSCAQHRGVFPAGTMCPACARAFAEIKAKVRP